MALTAGIGFKPQHFADALASPAVGLWFEVHAENYMVEGGPRLAMLETLRANFPLSLHGVGMSLASPERPCREHLSRMAQLVRLFEPDLVSEHLAWSRAGARCLPDLLPVPRTSAALEAVAANVAEVQDALGRPILIENPSHYIALPEHEWSEPWFLAELSRRTGCGLLLDLNNLAVSAVNLGFAAHAWLENLPADRVREIHLAGSEDDANLDLKIDSHGAPVGEDVWDLHRAFCDRHGPRPTLIERDRDVPPFAALLLERERAADQLLQCREFADA